MGRKTYESLGKPLPGRKNIVLTSQALILPDLVIVHSKEELIALNIPTEEIFVIGGAKIYELLLPLCDTLLVTHVHRRVEGDTFFPVFEDKFEPSEILIERSEFTIREYQRKQQE